METVTTWRDQEDEPYTKIINEAFPEPEPEPEPNTQYPHRPNYVGPSNLGGAGRAIEGDVVTAGLAYGASAAIEPIAKILGPAGIIDAGINIATGESDTPFEKKLEIFKPAKVVAKSGRIFKDMLTNIFDKRVDRDYYTKGPLDTLKTALTGGLDVGTARDVSGPAFRHSILNKTNRGLYKQLKNQDPKLIDQAENIIKELDLFKTSEGSSQQFTKWNSDRPTTGFRGTRTVPYINSDGVASEVAFRWSKSANNGAGGYKAYDLVRRQNTILKRLRWNVNRSPKAKWYSDKVYKIAKQDNAVLRQLLKELREENPQRYFDIMGDTRRYATNKGFIFVEHIHAQNSPYWKYISKGQFKPRDTSNLMIVKNENFGKLKTSIEKHIYDNKDFVFPEGKRLILDYDKTRDVLVLKQLQDNGRLKRMGDISPITNPRNWKRALDAALEGHTIQTGKVGEIQQVIQGDPDIDRNVDLQHGISDWK
tara:strand:+ start:55 stop:1491 length:1437 start_codon:yes stop_codon:yes gene_type:complete